METAAAHARGSWLRLETGAHTTMARTTATTTEQRGTDADLVMVKAQPFNAETAPTALGHTLTPTAQHFVRSNFDVPQHPGQIVIDGAVDRPTTLTLENIMSRPSKTLTVTLECAGNGRLGMAPLPEGEPWGGYAVGTSTWTGVPLADVLAEVGVQDDVIEVSFTGADIGTYKGTPDTQFVRALSREVALDRGRDVLVVYAMNDEPLTPAHGGPFRLLVPGWYGMASVKWLARISMRTQPYEGRFQTVSYMFHWAEGPPTPVSTMRVNSRVVQPKPGSTVHEGHVTVHGKAWSGAGQPIVSVEVSVDAGPWQTAELATSDSAYAWQDWTFDWHVAGAGRHVLRTRATDAAGNVQPDQVEWNRLGYGNNAIQAALFSVTAS